MGIWARQPKNPDGTCPGVKESLRWIEGYERLAEMAPKLPQTRLVYVADREADIMALMLRARELHTPVDWLVRAKHNRALAKGTKLWPQVTATQSLGSISFTMPCHAIAARQGKARSLAT